MVVKRKPILRKAPARKAPARHAGAIEKQASMRRHLESLRQPMNRIDPGNDGGMISLDPREWGENGGFSGGGKDGDNFAYPAVPGANPNVPQMDDALRKFRDEQAVKFPQLPQKPIGPGGIQIDPREAGGFDQISNQVQRDMQGGIPGRFRQAIDGFRAGLPNKQIPVPMPGFNPPGSGSPAPMPGGDGTIRLDPREWGENGGFNQTPGINKPMPSMPGDGTIRLDPREWGENGGFGKPGISKPMPPMPGGGTIRLDPREWGENGGFNQQPKPNPVLGGGKTMPMPSPGRMPQPNPRRNLIPRPIDPRFKMM